MAKISQIRVDGILYDLPSGGGGGSSYEWQAYVISASGWSNGVYSLESTYSSSSYDITDIVVPNTASDAQRTAWISADCGGYSETNTITAHGTVPTIDIPVVLCVVAK